MFKHGFPPEWSTLKKLIWLVGSGIAGAASGIWKTVTGALIHITDALASPVKELSVAIEPQQSGSGDPSPTNVRPITGWTGCNINVSGADTSNPTVYPISWQTEAGTVYGGTLTINEDGSVDLVRTFDSALAMPAGWSWGWSYYSNGGYFRSNQFASIKKGQNNVVTTARCSMLKPTAPNNIQDLSINITAETKPRVVIKDTSLSGDVNAFKTKYAEAVLVYERAAPLTYHLDSIEALYTLVGENNIWADVNGEITLTYQAVPQTAFSDEADKGMADYMTLTE